MRGLKPGRNAGASVSRALAGALHGLRGTEDKDNGQIANFDFLFVEAGEQPGPSSFINTALSVLRQVETVIAEVQSVSTIGVALTQAPAALISSFTGWCTGLVGSLTALPLASEYSLALLLPGIVAMPTDPAATAGAIVGVTGAYAQAIVDGTLSLASDQTGGLADLATWGGDILAANTGSTPTLAQQAANAQATVDLVRGAAVAAVATVYAGIDWTSANAAAAARDRRSDRGPHGRRGGGGAGCALRGVAGAGVDRVAGPGAAGAAASAAHRLHVAVASAGGRVGLSAVSGRDAGNAACAAQ